MVGNRSTSPRLPYAYLLFFAAEPFRSDKVCHLIPKLSVVPVRRTTRPVALRGRQPICIRVGQSDDWSLQ